MLTKPDMWESEEFRRKFSKIPKSLQGEFLRAIQELYRQESESMLRFIQMSRQSLRSAGIEIRDEQQALQVTSRKLNDERRQNRAKAAAAAGPRKHKSNAVVPHTDYNMPTAAKPVTRTNTMEQSDDTEDDEQFFKEETEEIFRATSRADNVHANERARQMEKIERLKKERRAKKDADKGKAEELIREASNLEKQRSDEKKKQEDIVKEKLEKRRKKKSHQKSVDTDVIDDADAVAAAPDPPTEDPEEDEGKKEKSKKKKDKDKKKKKKKLEEEQKALPSDSPV